VGVCERHCLCWERLQQSLQICFIIVAGTTSATAQMTTGLQIVLTGVIKDFGPNRLNL
jgi:hypothetical protein